MTYAIGPRVARIVVLALLWIAPFAWAMAEPGGPQLATARQQFESDLEAFRSSVERHFEAREASARAAGDKAALDLARSDRARFKTSAELPLSVPEPLRLRRVRARAKMEVALRNAIKDSVRAMKDDDAEVLQKELEALQHEVLDSLFLGKARPLRVQVARPACFDIQNFKVKGTDYHNSILLHPAIHTPAIATYRVSKDWRTFESRVAIFRAEPNKELGSPVTFEILGDDKLLWRSDAIETFEEISACKIDVAGVELLTLRTSVAGSDSWAWATWLDPKLSR